MFEMFNNIVGVETRMGIRGTVVRLSTRARDISSSQRQDLPRAHPASYSMDTGS